MITSREEITKFFEIFESVELKEINGNFKDLSKKISFFRDCRLVISEEIIDRICKKFNADFQEDKIILSEYSSDWFEKIRVANKNNDEFFNFLNSSIVSRKEMIVNYGDGVIQELILWTLFLFTEKYNSLDKIKEIVDIVFLTEKIIDFLRNYLDNDEFPSNNITHVGIKKLTLLRVMNVRSTNPQNNSNLSYKQKIIRTIDSLQLSLKKIKLIKEIGKEDWLTSELNIDRFRKSLIDSISLTKGSEAGWEDYLYASSDENQLDKRKEECNELIKNRKATERKTKNLEKIDNLILMAEKEIISTKIENFIFRMTAIEKWKNSEDKEQRESYNLRKNDISRILIKLRYRKKSIEENKDKSIEENKDKSIEENKDKSIEENKDKSIEENKDKSIEENNKKDLWKVLGITVFLVLFPIISAYFWKRLKLQKLVKVKK